MSRVGGVIRLPSPSKPAPPTGSVYSGMPRVGGVIRLPSPSKPAPPTGSVYSGMSRVGGVIRLPSPSKPAPLTGSVYSGMSRVGGVIFVPIRITRSTIGVFFTNGATSLVTPVDVFNEYVVVITLRPSEPCTSIRSSFTSSVES